MIRTILVLLLPALLLACPFMARGEWTPVLPGLEVGEFPPPENSPGAGKKTVVVARVDPSRLSLALHFASSPGQATATVRQWVRDKGLLVGINASMYLPDGKKSTGYLASGDQVNNARVNRRFGAFLVFDPAGEGDLPPARILDREADDWRGLMPRYGSVAQNFRMIEADGSIAWKPDRESHSVACVAQDANGQLLFIHSQSAYTVHDFTQTLLALPLSISRAMYVEGGFQASLVVDAPGFFLEVSGFSRCPGPNPLPCPAWPVPNVLGVRR
ncbi:MAG: phosphodiester glycosidase family protein [Proteobacteria bacterium]|nr:phosphodiester glycosidase family protein [Pseudomonadota bacterium]